MNQVALLCGCGAANLFRGGLCKRCYRRARLNREKFAGNREAALARDGEQCQVCGELQSRLILVHHRRRGAKLLRFLLTVCRRCHVRVHRTFRPGFAFSRHKLLLELWREAHPGLPLQRSLALYGDESDSDGATIQAPLFDSSGLV